MVKDLKVPLDSELAIGLKDTQMVITLLLLYYHIMLPLIGS